MSGPPVPLASLPEGRCPIPGCRWAVGVVDEGDAIRLTRSEAEAYRHLRTHLPEDWLRALADAQAH